MESRDIEVREEGYAAMYSQSPSPPLEIDVSLALPPWQIFHSCTVRYSYRARVSILNILVILLCTVVSCSLSVSTA